MMKKLAFLIAAMIFALPNTVLADEAEGMIVSIDESGQTLKLDDGNEYKLPGEFDYTVIAKDMKVLLVFDVNGKEKLITDIEKSE